MKILYCILELSTRIHIYPAISCDSTSNVDIAFADSATISAARVALHLASVLFSAIVVVIFQLIQSYSNQRTCGATVARRIPAVTGCYPKVACSNHVRFNFCIHTLFLLRSYVASVFFIIAN